ncbi:hypothetical protein [Methylobacterium oxalidis]|uniref:hypothetical protein n=1 Tax=Methylobacterium oxalidis TaxID=944322 RepID=UPI0033152C1B
MAPEKGQPSTALDDAAGNPVGAASIGLGGMADAIAEVANSEARDVPSPAASTPRAGSATVSVPEVMAQAHPGAFHPDQGVSAAHEGRSAGEVLDSATSDDRFPTHPLSDAVDGPVATPTLLGTLLAASGIQTDTIDAHPQTLGNSALGAGGEATDTGSVIGAEEWVGLPAQSHKISYVEAAPDLTGANSIPNEGGGQTLAAAQDHGIPDQSGTGTATGLTDPAAGSVAGETQRTYDSKADHDSANSAEAAASADAEGTRATKMQSEEAISDSVAQTHKTVSTTIDVAIVDSQNIAALPNGTADEDEEDGKAEAVDEVEKDSSLLPEDKDKFVFPQDHGKPTDFANSEASVADPSAKYFLDVAAVDAREVDPKAHVQSIGADRHLPAPGIDAEAQTGLDGISSPDNMQVFTNHALIDSVLFA